MKKIFPVMLCLIAAAASAQTDTVTSFNKIARELEGFKIDTTTPPEDKITRKISELRELRGGFNIHEAIQFKIGEDRQKNEIPKEQIDQLAAFFTTGNGGRWLNNAVTWIYRKHFSYKELKQLVKFYKTSAGRKMADDFPVIMLQSLKAAETIKEMHGERNRKRLSGSH